MEQSPEQSRCHPSIRVRVRRVKQRSYEGDATMTWSIRRAALIVFGVSMTTVAVSVLHLVSTSSNQHRRQRQLENRHPLSVAATTQRKRQLRAAVSSTRQPQKLHYLSFGSSNTWGIGMDRRSHHEYTTPTLVAEVEAEATSSVHLTAYPHLLDTNVLSVALPSSRAYADLAAACAQSLVEGTTLHTQQASSSLPPIWSPDVITVEYSNELTPSHIVLLQRLRRRFPKSIQVLVQLFQPATQLLLEESTSTSTSGPATKKSTSLQSWWQRQNQQATGKSTLDGESLAHSLFLESSGRNASYRWSLDTTAHEQTRQRVEQLLRDDPLLLHYDDLSTLPSLQTEEDWSAYLSLFATDTFDDLSALGHARVAGDIQTLVDAAKRQGLSTTTTTTTTLMDGSWGSGDECNLWYANGNYESLESTTAQRVNLPLAFDATHKHALEFSPTTAQANAEARLAEGQPTVPDDQTNQISVHNPFATDRLLSLTYLTDVDGMTYPHTRIVLNGVPTLELHPIHIPFVSGTSGSDRQYTRTTGVGFIPPGKSTIRLDPLQSTLSSFRLLGASFLAEEVQHLTSIEFSLETDA